MQRNRAGRYGIRGIPYRDYTHVGAAFGLPSLIRSAATPSASHEASPNRAQPADSVHGFDAYPPIPSARSEKVVENHGSVYISHKYIASELGIFRRQVFDVAKNDAYPSITATKLMAMDGIDGYAFQASRCFRRGSLAPGRRSRCGAFSPNRCFRHGPLSPNLYL